MKKYAVPVDYVMTTTVVVEARDEESAMRKVGKYVHTHKGFDEYVKAAAPRNVLFGIVECCGDDGFDIPYDPEEYDGTVYDGWIEI